VEACKPWLCQGDVFASVPLTVTSLVGADGVQCVVREGPALLLTHDCQLDKRGLSRLVFAPVSSPTDAGVTGSNLGQLRKGWLTPPEAIWLPDAGNGEEAVALLGQAFMIPTAYFDLAVEDFSYHLEHDPELPWHARVRREERDTRAATMSADEAQLMRCKMSAYWTGEVPEGCPDR
jgi:hypothetical protein